GSLEREPHADLSRARYRAAAKRGVGQEVGRARVTVGAGHFEVRPVGEVEHLAEHVQVPRPEPDAVAEAHVGLEEAGTTRPVAAAVAGDGEGVGASAGILTSGQWIEQDSV